MLLTTSEFYALYILYQRLTSCSAIANQESLSALETEMRKLEGVVKEIVDEMNYLKKREERFQSTNRTSLFTHIFIMTMIYILCQFRRTTVSKTSRGSRSSRSSAWDSGRYSTYARSLNGSISLTEIPVFVMMM